MTSSEVSTGGGVYDVTLFGVRPRQPRSWLATRKLHNDGWLRGGGTSKPKRQWCCSTVD